MDSIQEYLLDPGVHAPPEIERFLNGDCDLFAIAVQRLTGWNIVSIIEPRLITWDGLSVRPNQIGLVHAVCIKDRYINSVFDAKGWRDYSAMAREYKNHMDCYVREMTEHELHSLVYPNQPIDEDEVRKTMIFVEQYYRQFLGEQT